MLEGTLPLHLGATPAFTKLAFGGRSPLPIVLVGIGIIIRRRYGGGGCVHALENAGEPNIRFAAPPPGTGWAHDPGTSDPAVLSNCTWKRVSG